MERRGNKRGEGGRDNNRWGTWSQCIIYIYEIVKNTEIRSRERKGVWVHQCR